ncbi:MAG: SDR family NAD(P)-dependent oxidoreductase [Flavobacteriales bacterium]|nr:SDR family NAD(P)-dependent oxidoreductase [Flavobacteriales bacterium]
MNVFITGGLSGLGMDLAHRFLDDGHTVGLCDLQSDAEAEELLKSGIQYFQADVCDKDRLSEVIHQFSKANGVLDIVVANAGISMPKAKIPDFDRGRKVIEINVIGVLNTFEPAIEIMKEQGHGQLVGLGSVAGRVGLTGVAIYGASKSAVINLCESFEIDLATYGIHVTTIAPGFIDTPLTSHLKHKMPFKISQAEAVDLMYKAILKKKGLYILPFKMGILSRILYHLPRPLYKYLQKQDPLGLTKH